MLAVDGVISAVLGAVFMPIYLGSVPFPVSAVLSGLLNAALVWAASIWTDSRRIAATPLLAWLATSAILMMGGPGNDIVFGGPGLLAYSVLLFLVLGAAPPVWVLRRDTTRTDAE